jgi:hypothetical protein
LLNDTKAAALPMEKPIKFDSIVNLKVAKQIGLTRPLKNPNL